MIYKARKGQVNYGESIGIILLDSFTPFIPGDVGNATTYSYPVRYKTIKGFTLDKMYAMDVSFLEAFKEAGRELVQDGVRAITGDCGYMALFQREMADELEVPVFLSSLLQVPFISRTLGNDEKVGIICANAKVLNESLLRAVGVTDEPYAIVGLEEKEYFHKGVIAEVGELHADKVEKEVVEAALELVESDPKVKAILLECSVLPPYAAAVQEAVNLPVFDFITMIDYVQSAVVKKRYHGYM
ncbi:aspartate/glutamate racemase family protein [Brevibacillus marinus]|uniref:aspartate/glutamate racemase family protein n=1 Tax=Brevibacillus marinus TaxID=2496837 RepID=UPI000F82F8D1|nr:aspartate/glutamate racemase family protein [Brevibacillus marinus]